MRALPPANMGAGRAGETSSRRIISGGFHHKARTTTGREPASAGASYPQATTDGSIAAASRASARRHRRRSPGDREQANRLVDSSIMMAAVTVSTAVAVSGVVPDRLRAGAGASAPERGRSGPPHGRGGALRPRATPGSSRDIRGRHACRRSRVPSIITRAMARSPRSPSRSGKGTRSSIWSRMAAWQTSKSSPSPSPPSSPSRCGGRSPASRGR